MKLLTRRRTAATDTTPHHLDPDDTPEAGETEEIADPGAHTDPSTVSTSALAMEWTGPAAWITRSLSWVLVASLATGPAALALGGWVVITSPGASTTPTSSSSDASAADARTAVESFATEFVSTWLTTTTGQEARLDPFLPDLSAVTVPDVPEAISGVSAAGIKATGTQTWSITVAATTTAPAPADADPAAGPDPSTVSSRRYFQVPIYRAQDGSLIGLALPSPIAGPQLATGPNLGYRYRASTTDPIALAVGEFLNALLTGVGDVTRLTTPGSPIRAITPAPYAAVSLDDVEVDQDPASINDADLADGRETRVLVTATAAPSTPDPAAAEPAADQGVSVQYALTLTTRAGRWEVTTIDPGPLTSSGESTATEPAQDTDPSPAGSPTLPTDPSFTN